MIDHLFHFLTVSFADPVSNAPFPGCLGHLQRQPLHCALAGADGADYFSAALKRNTALQCIRLGSNNIGAGVDGWFFGFSCVRATDQPSSLLMVMFAFLSGTSRRCQHGANSHFGRVFSTFGLMHQNVVTSRGGGGVCFLKSVRKGRFRNVWVWGGYVVTILSTEL